MPNPIRILLAESDDVLRARLAEQLEHEGYDVVAAHSAADLKRALNGTSLAFAIIGLADGDMLAAQLRDAGLGAPILLLTDGEAENTQESLTKPFRFSAL